MAPQHQGLPQEEVGVGAKGTGAQHQPETTDCTLSSSTEDTRRQSEHDEINTI